MAGAGVEIKGDPIRDLLKLANGEVIRQLRPVIGDAAVEVVQRRLEELNETRPNKLGGPRTNFYANAATSTSWTVLPDGVLVSINQQGIRLRLEGTKPGNPIVPGPGKTFLTIPAVADAHGKRASDFAGQLVVSQVIDPRTGRLRRALVEAQATNLETKRRKGKASYQAGTVRTGRVAIFWLVRRVTQKPDPTVLPTREQLIARIFPEVEAEFRRLTDTPAS